MISGEVIKWEKDVWRGVFVKQMKINNPFLTTQTKKKLSLFLQLVILMYTPTYLSKKP